MNEILSPKSMTIGEACLAPLFLIAAFLCLSGVAKAVDSAFAFHASLGIAASLRRRLRSITAISIAPPYCPPTLPAKAEPGTAVYAGTLNLSGTLRVRSPRRHLSPICRCWARWWISNSTTKTPTAVSGPELSEMHRWQRPCRTATRADLWFGATRNQARTRRRVRSPRLSSVRGPSGRSRRAAE
jgi:hypothetical protein